jgi:hypothetical protein
MSSFSQNNVEIQDLVALLNGPPLYANVGLVDFSKKSPSELLQVVSDILTCLEERPPLPNAIHSTSQPVKPKMKEIRDESRDQLTTRFMEAVTTVSYPIEGEK